MGLVSDTATNPELLRMVADWDDHPAWARFHGRYDPLLRRWCCGHGLDADSADEVCQRIWIELAGRMRTFRYDPARTFRGWLRRLCDSRTVDFLRRRRAEGGVPGLEDCAGEREDGAVGTMADPADSDPAVADDEEGRLLLFGEAQRIQDVVRRKVQPRTWEAFWLVAVCDWAVERTAQTLGMTHVAVYAARERVARMLREEGNRVSGRMSPGS